MDHAAAVKKYVPGADDKTIGAIVKHLGIALRNRDSSLVSCSDPNDPSTWGKVSRNEACPCGSGKKYKHCHGAIA